MITRWAGSSIYIGTLKVSGFNQL